MCIQKSIFYLYINLGRTFVLPVIFDDTGRSERVSDNVIKSPAFAGLATNFR